MLPKLLGKYNGNTHDIFIIDFLETKGGGDDHRSN